MYSSVYNKDSMILKCVIILLLCICMVFTILLYYERSSGEYHLSPISISHLCGQYSRAYSSSTVNTDLTLGTTVDLQLITIYPNNTIEYMGRRCPITYYQSEGSSLYKVHIQNDDDELLNGTFHILSFNDDHSISTTVVLVPDTRVAPSDVIILCKVLPVEYDHIHSTFLYTNTSSSTDTIIVQNHNGLFDNCPFNIHALLINPTVINNQEIPTLYAESIILTNRQYFEDVFHISSPQNLDTHTSNLLSLRAREALYYTLASLPAERISLYSQQCECLGRMLTAISLYLLKYIGTLTQHMTSSLQYDQLENICNCVREQLYHISCLKEIVHVLKICTLTKLPVMDDTVHIKLLFAYVIEYLNNCVQDVDDSPILYSMYSEILKDLHEHSNIVMEIIMK